MVLSLHNKWRPLIYTQKFYGKSSTIPALFIVGALLCLVYLTIDKNADETNTARSENIAISLDEAIKPFEIVQDDPRLIEKIRREYLYPPSSEEYNITTKGDPSVWQAAAVFKLLKNKTKGFFIEAGANDGEFISNTLNFERNLGWEGLLVEPDPENFKIMMKKHRKAWAIRTCLSTSNHPKMLVFQQNRDRSRLITMPKETDKKFEVQCFPLYSILLALGRTKVDYFSLDVEGAELDVLKSIPWDKVNIATLSVEYDHLMDRKPELRKYMEDQGYRTMETPPQNGLAVDLLFYRKDLPQQ